MSNPEKDRPDTDESVDHLPGDATKPLDADEEEPDIKPFAGDDDIASGQYGPGA